MTNHEVSQVPCGWPERLPAGVVRWARSSSNYDDTIAFYRDLVGLPIVDSFSESFGEDGTIFGLRDIQTQMEIVRSNDATRQADEFDQVVFYLEDADAVTEATTPLRDSGLQPDSKAHSYWKANGAVVYRDPDGRSVVFAPWVFGRVPDPVDR